MRRIGGWLLSMGAAQVYEQFTADGYLTVPEGATAVCVPMWTPSPEWEIYLLDAEHRFAEDVCGSCPLQRGDMDGDGQVSTEDAVYLLYHILLPEQHPLEQSGELDGRGALNSVIFFITP